MLARAAWLLLMIEVYAFYLLLSLLADDAEFLLAFVGASHAWRCHLRRRRHESFDWECSPISLYFALLRPRARDWRIAPQKSTFCAAAFRH